MGCSSGNLSVRSVCAGSVVPCYTSIASRNVALSNIRIVPFADTSIASSQIISSCSIFAYGYPLIVSVNGSSLTSNLVISVFPTYFGITPSSIMNVRSVIGIPEWVIIPPVRSVEYQTKS